MVYLDWLPFSPLLQVGIWNVISVPDGAPAKVQPPPDNSSGGSFDVEQDVKFSYIWQVGVGG